MVSTPLSPRVTRPVLDELDMPLGKRVRLRRLLYEHGPGGGAMLLLSVDQGLEHGPGDFFANPEALDPHVPWDLAREGGFSGIVAHVGVVERYLRPFAGIVPLVLRVNGRTNIPSDAHALSPFTASVEDALRLGADAVGYTLYVGSPAQVADIANFASLREECNRVGLPLIVWASPRGEAIERRGGRYSLYAIDYGARVAEELGADVVVLNPPFVNPDRDAESPKPYNAHGLTTEEALRKVIASAGRTMALVAGGERKHDDDLLDRARRAMDAGATGLVVGRNIWQRPAGQGLTVANRLRKLLRDYNA